MSNIISIPHTVTFLAKINIDNTPANLLPALIALSEEQLTAMVKETTIHALHMTKFAEQANEGSMGWATVSIVE